MPKFAIGKILVLSFFIFSAFGVDALAQSAQHFFVEPSYDALKRDELSASLIKTTSKVSWYVEDEWWNGLSEGQKLDIQGDAGRLSQEFESKIYPVLTAKFGSEWTPGIDGDPRLAILLHRMKKDVSGYWTSADEFEKLQIPTSNEREMVYLNAEKIGGDVAKSFLAHEFTHLIEFQQKDRAFNVSDDSWFYEMLAEVAPTILGYDDILNGSYLEQRVDRFLSRPADPLTEWQSDLYDYGVVNIFGQYLRNRYGDSVLSDALKSRNTGMKSITAALNKNGFSEDFAQVFTDWTIAMAINNCSAGQAYCLKDGNLKNLRVIPSTYFLPLSGESTVSITVQSKDWAGNWYKFIGGHDTVTLEFKSPEELNVKIPYILDMSDGTFSVSVLKVGSDSIGKLEIPGFGKTVRSLIIIPSVQDKVSDISGSYPSYVLSWTVKISGGEETEPIIVERPRPQTGVSYTAAELQRKIAEIQQTIAALRAQLAAAQGGTVSGVSSCGPFEKNLYYGMKGAEVSCLQDFLKKQGPDIYPEGLVTGNFLGLTKAAVIRFQEKYAYEILAPLSFSHGTGFVGSMTRAKINKL
ncbi:MAG: hypothetical protein A3A32_02730 [Candidatus Wildermuthbacteria bacterium RIFCSPLOWO2_01_FULL_48_35]|uniref:Peptidoglycan binding-like domain-containing protein n=1 Tax=Candidatus Wildermuthbacteria bacterium RIFCSPLOWO2_01_FULL_48_35 TaxID=1802463 RepID=A0A1G2RNZ5_9BACT|nr:MAG: hypothetical protein A3A32_02730 [Candidatus Wildermuthbacteria bacterium RIFCSPLOWO2_01_FULL_48_35]